MSKKKDPMATSNGKPADAAPEVPADAAPAPEANGNGEAKRPPAHVVRIGRLKATIWVNFAKDGRPYYGVTTCRIYRTVDGEWGQATSYDRGDLLPLAEVLRQAFLWIAQNPLTGGDDDVPF